MMLCLCLPYLQDPTGSPRQTPVEVPPPLPQHPLRRRARIPAVVPYYTCSVHLRNVRVLTQEPASSGGVSCPPAGFGSSPEPSALTASAPPRNPPPDLLSLSLALCPTHLAILCLSSDLAPLPGQDLGLHKLLLVVGHEALSADVEGPGLGLQTLLL